MSGGIRQAAALALPLALALSGCTADSESTATLSSTVEPGRSASTTAQGAGGEDAGGEPSSIREAPARPPGAVPPAGFRGPDVAAPGGTLPLEFRLDPGCVEHGQALNVVGRTDPGLYVSAQVVFPASDFEHTPQKRGTADQSGRITWKVPVGSEAGAGEASLLASVRDPDGEGPGTSGTWRFVVRAPGACGDA